ncbi:MAG: tetratricopeptide repeat protein [Planctomycetota bacterium]|nr:MAG: tetratricopeptide repeat protein [Planctomycetota bacterium]
MQALTIDPDDSEARKELRATQIKRNQVLGSGGLAALKGLMPKIKMGIYKAMKKWDECIRECESYLAIDPKNKAALQTLGEACSQAGYFHSAILAYEDLVELDKQDVKAYKELGFLYCDIEDFKTATQYFEKAKKLAPQDGEIHKILRDIAAKGAESQMQDGLAKGEGSFRGIVKDQKTAKKLMKKNQKLRTKEDILEAIEYAKEEIEEEPIPKNYRNLAELYIRLKDYAKAEEAYNKALEIDPRDVPSINGKAELQILQFDEMIQKLNKKLKESPSPELKQKLKKIKAQKLEFCIQEWDRRVKDQPTNLGLKYEYGNYLLKGGKVDEAIAQFQRALKDPKREIDTHIKLGQCFEKKKKYDLAIKEYEKVLKKMTSMDDDKAKEVTYALGRAYMSKGDREKARAQFEKIYEVDISYKDVAEKLESLH